MRTLTDLPPRIGRLVVQEGLPNDRVRCQCECGKEVIRTRRSLCEAVAKKANSGCKRCGKNPAREKIGKAFGAVGYRGTT